MIITSPDVELEDGWYIYEYLVGTKDKLFFNVKIRLNFMQGIDLFDKEIDLKEMLS